MTTKNSLSKALKKEGLRFTSQRQAVWDEIKSNDDHRDAEQIYSALRKNNLNVSPESDSRFFLIFRIAMEAFSFVLYCRSEKKCFNLVQT